MSALSLPRMIGRVLAGWFGFPRPTEDVRDSLFPDPSLRADENHPAALFDPFSLRLAIEQAPPFRDEHRLLMRGEIEQVKKKVLPEFWLKNAAGRQAYILWMTSGLHELRHYHDHFGTTAGFLRVVSTVRDGLEFNRVWDQLRKLPEIRLPLGNWAKSPGAPDVLKDYIQARKQYVTWFNLADHGMAPTRLGSGLTTLIYGIRGITAVVPTVTLSLGDAATGRSEHIAVPLGVRALLEGNAAVVQRIATGWVFGSDYGSLMMKDYLRQGPAADLRWIDYVAVDRYLTKLLTKFYARFHLAYSDLALMSEKPEDLLHHHPGVRLTECVIEAKGMPPHYQQPEGDLAAYLDELADRLKWKRLSAVAQTALDAADQQITRLNALAEKDTLWPRILRAVHGLHREFMRIRVERPTVLADPVVYMAFLPHLPPPPIFQEGRSLVFQGTDPVAYRCWFFFEHFQRHVLSGHEMPCAGAAEDHDCPGDAFGNGWKPRDTCPFSLFLAQLGWPHAKFQNAAGT